MFLTPKLKDAAKRFHKALGRKQGLCAILGANGLGKSTLLRHIALHYEGEEDKYVVSYLADSRKCGASAFAFMKVICEDFGIPPKRSQAAQLNAIEEFLAASHRAGKNVIVFIDEAQRLPLDTFEVVRALLNYETDTHKLIQFVVAGQLDLLERLNTDRYRGFKSRIVAPFLMDPLSLEEMQSMIEYRLDHFDVHPNPFAADALQLIHQYSLGNPRDALSLCQQSYDAADEGQQVTPRDVEAAFRSFQRIGKPPVQEAEPLPATV